MRGAPLANGFFWIFALKAHPLLIELIWMHLELSGETRGINTSTQMKGHFFVELLVLNLIVCQTRGGRRLKGTLGLHLRNEGTKATLSSEVKASHIFYCSAEQYCFTYGAVQYCFTNGDINV